MEVERKQHMITALTSGVTPEGLKLFNAIKKTIDDVIWDGKDIKVMEQVTIRPPYLPENILGSPQADKAVNHVRKIVEKHLKDQIGVKESTSNSPLISSNNTSNNIISDSNSSTAAAAQ